MVHGKHIYRCLHCGAQEVCGDCIPSTCPKCSEAGHKASPWNCPECERIRRESWQRPLLDVLGVLREVFPTSDTRMAADKVRELVNRLENAEAEAKRWRLRSKGYRRAL